MYIADQNGVWHNSEYIVNLEIVSDLSESSIIARDVFNETSELCKFTGINTRNNAEIRLRNIIAYVYTEKSLLIRMVILYAVTQEASNVKRGIYVYIWQSSW